MGGCKGKGEHEATWWDVKGIFKCQAAAHWPGPLGHKVSKPAPCFLLGHGPYSHTNQRNTAKPARGWGTTPVTRRDRSVKRKNIIALPLARCFAGVGEGRSSARDSPSARAFVPPTLALSTSHHIPCVFRPTHLFPPPQKKNQTHGPVPLSLSASGVTMALPPMFLLLLCTLLMTTTTHAFVVGPAQPFDAAAVAAGPTSRTQRCRSTGQASAASPNNDFYGRSFQRKSTGDHPLLSLPLPRTSPSFLPPSNQKKLWACRCQNPRVR